MSICKFPFKAEDFEVFTHTTGKIGRLDAEAEVIGSIGSADVWPVLVDGAQEVVRKMGTPFPDSLAECGNIGCHTTGPASAAFSLSSLCRAGQEAPYR